MTCTISHGKRRVVFKYEIPPSDQRFDSEVQLPKGAEILCINAQRSKLFIWALIDPTQREKTTHRFVVVPTGVEFFSSGKDTLVFETTVFLDTLVFHVFSVREEARPQ